MAKKTFVCTVCETEEPVPVCCEQGMQVKNGVLVCSMCGTGQPLPLCCGKKMKFTGPYE